MSFDHETASCCLRALALARMSAAVRSSPGFHRRRRPVVVASGGGGGGEQEKARVADAPARRARERVTLRWAYSGELKA